MHNSLAPAPPPLLSAHSDYGNAANPDKPDYLAAALLQSLMRPLQGPFSFSLLGTIFLTVISLGLVPLALLLGRLRGFTRRERDQLYHLAQWLRVQFGPDADHVWDSTPGMNRLIVLSRFLVGFCIVAVLCKFALFFADGGDLNGLVSATIGAAPERYHHPWLTHSEIFAWWMSWLTIGYATCWLVNLAHQARIRGFVERFNTLMNRKGLAPVSIEPIALGLHPLWLIAGLIAASNGLFWALPAALAGAVQRRYTTRNSRAIRAALAQRVREIVAATRPGTGFDIPEVLRRKCDNDRCMARLPSNATFCPRCGKKVESGIGFRGSGVG